MKVRRVDQAVIDILALGPPEGMGAYEVSRAYREWQERPLWGNPVAALLRLEQAGLIRGDWGTKAGQVRRLYRLTGWQVKT